MLPISAFLIGRGAGFVVCSQFCFDEKGSWNSRVAEVSKHTIIPLHSFLVFLMSTLCYWLFWILWDCLLGKFVMQTWTPPKILKGWHLCTEYGSSNFRHNNIKGSQEWPNLTMLHLLASWPTISGSRRYYFQTFTVTFLALLIYIKLTKQIKLEKS
jgi:hypothetical protein